MFFKRKKKRKAGRSSKPIVHLYSICWNEEFMLPYFFRHYDHIVDRYIFFDDGSDDRTLEILERHPKAEIRRLPRIKVDSYVLSAREVHNNCWKQSKRKADWVIISAVDEMLYHDDLLTYLKACDKEGITLIPALGFQMVSDDLPDPSKRITASIIRGMPDPRWMSKLCLFKPDEIQSTGFDEGRHMARPTGNLVYPERDQLLNLHYKYINPERTFRRQQALGAKLGSMDREKGWGYQYNDSIEQIRLQFDFFKSRSVENVIAYREQAHDHHSPIHERWWRKQMIENGAPDNI